MQAGIFSIAAVLPTSAIDGFRLTVLPFGAKQVAFFQNEENVVGILRLERPHDLKRFVETTLAAQENDQDDFCVNAGFSVSSGGLVQVFQALFLAASKPNHGVGGIYPPGQASHAHVVPTHHEIHVHATWVEL